MILFLLLIAVIAVVVMIIIGLVYAFSNNDCDIRQYETESYLDNNL